jgi:quercetin dioxygenase-like cupin family protein
LRDKQPFEAAELRARITNGAFPFRWLPVRFITYPTTAQATLSAISPCPEIRHLLDWLEKHWRLYCELATQEVASKGAKEELMMSTMQTDSELNSGPVLVGSDDGQTLAWGPGGKVRIIAGASSTDSSFSLVEVTDPPGGGAPLHVHHGEAEAFYILDGTVELTCGVQTVLGHAGDFVYAPKDVPHKYQVVGDKPARLLLLFSRPGFEMFFAEGGTPLDNVAARPPDPAAFRHLVEKYGMELLEAAPCH